MGVCNKYNVSQRRIMRIVRDKHRMILAINNKISGKTILKKKMTHDKFFKKQKRVKDLQCEIKLILFAYFNGDKNRV